MSLSKAKKITSEVINLPAHFYLFLTEVIIFHWNQLRPFLTLMSFQQFKNVSSTQEPRLPSYHSVIKYNDE